MAGIDNFQQSDLNISLQSLLSRDSVLDLDAGGLGGRLYVVAFSILEYAIMKEMEHLRSSTMRTAVAAEYASDGAVDTLE